MRRLLIAIYLDFLLCHGTSHRSFCTFFTDAAGQEAMVKTLYPSLSPAVVAFTSIMLSTIQGGGATNVAFRVELAAVTICMVVAAAVTLIWPQPIWVIWRVELATSLH